MSDILRSKEVSEAYKTYRELDKSDNCHLCTAPALHNFKHWKIIPNNFPYDRIASIHHMLVPMRHAVEAELTEDERRELWAIKSGHLNQNYDDLIEACVKNKSIPDHFHLHLLVLKTS